MLWLQVNPLELASAVLLCLFIGGLLWLSTLRRHRPHTITLTKLLGALISLMLLSGIAEDVTHHGPQYICGCRC
jgi:drug/metabolite transporter (DMT)-like permease